MKKLTCSSAILSGLLTISSLSACVDPSFNSGGGGGYNDPYAGGYNNSGSYNNGGYSGGESYEHRRERQRLERERDRLDDERRRLEDERRRNEDIYHRPPPAPAYRPPVYNPPAYNPPVERCPSGFSPSENKCSAEERRRGCKDMRLPGGLGCVHR